MSGYDVTVEPVAGVAWIAIRADDSALPALETALGAAFPRAVHAAAHGGGWSLLALSPDEWLLRTEPALEQPSWRMLHEAVQGVHAAVSVVSDQYSGFTLHGTDALAVLRQGVGIDLDMLPAGAHARCAFARCAGLLCVVEHARRYELFVESSYADYAALWLEVAAGRTG